jgi:hypothetical protein
VLYKKCFDEVDSFLSVDNVAYEEAKNDGDLTNDALQKLIETMQK